MSLVPTLTVKKLQEALQAKAKRSLTYRFWHRQPKGPATRMAHLNRRATSRLYVRREVVFLQRESVPPGNYRSSR